MWAPVPVQSGRGSGPIPDAVPAEGAVDVKRHRQYDEAMPRRPSSYLRFSAAVTATLLPLALMGPAAGAPVTHGDTLLVTGTVYDGVYADTQNSWSAVQVQFEVTPGDRIINIAPAVAFCAPTQSFPLAGADVRNDKFISYTSPAPHYSVTITGTFESDGKAKGTGTLRAETIQDQPCTEEADWTAAALPKGTELCFSVDPDFLVKTTVTNMTCGEAFVAVAHGSTGSGGLDFSTPGWDCTSGTHDPVARYVCTQGAKIFRLPY